MANAAHRAQTDLNSFTDLINARLVHFHLNSPDLSLSELQAHLMVKADGCKSYFLPLTLHEGRIGTSF